MLTVIDNATNVASAFGSQTSAFGVGASSVSVSSSLTEKARASASVASTPQPLTRPAIPGEPGFLTVEPDGRDDVSFRDRLRQALESVFQAVQETAEDAARASRNALQAVEQPLEGAATSGEVFFAQVRVVGIEVNFAEVGSDGSSSFASVRQFGVEVSFARAGFVQSDDVSVLSLEGKSLSFTATEIQAGFQSGTYSRTDAGASSTASREISEELKAAQASIARIKAVQDALSAFRDGNDEPLRQLSEGFSSDSSGRGSPFIPGLGALRLG